MFSKKKKSFPPGTLLPKSKRIVAILHLCLVFTVICWTGGYPFMGELYHLKSRKALYESLFQDKQQFSQLPPFEQEAIREGYQKLQQDSQLSASVKFDRSLEILAFYLPPFFQAWILFSVLIPILILLRREGAVTVAWLLPLLALLYCWDNALHGKSMADSKEAALFPSEEYLIEYYSDAPLSSSILKQQQQLESAWQEYLDVEWQGSYAFRLAQVKAAAADDQVGYGWRFRQKKSPLLLLVFLGWNLFFAFSFTEKKKKPALS